MNEQAKKILLKAYWGSGGWKDGTVSDEDFAYAKEHGLADDGYRLVMNCNEAAGQTVWHIHLHFLAGRTLDWPPG